MHAAAVGVGNASVPPQPTIFTKILNKEIPTDIVYEDDKIITYHLPPHHPKCWVSMPQSWVWLSAAGLHCLEHFRVQRYT